MDKTNLIKRGHVWCARVAIPRHLQDSLNKREIVRSLRTTSLAEANRLKHAVIAEIRKLIADAEQATGGRTSNSPTGKLLAGLRALRHERRMKLLPSGDVEQMRDHYADRAHDLIEHIKHVLSAEGQEPGDDNPIHAYLPGLRVTMPK
jgi:hypothetical protein